MLSKADIKLIHSLRDKKSRYETGLFVVEGEKMLEEAKKSDFKISQIIYLSEVGEDVMRKLSTSASVPPVIAVVCIPSQHSNSIEINKDRLCLALDSVRDPGNMGTIIRMAEWFGVETLYASEDSVEFYNPKLIQATMGSIFRVRCVTADIPELCKAYRKANLPVYGTLLDGDNIYSNTLSANGLLVMGNESRGISEEVAEELSHKLLIPSFGNCGAESLNVAVATAVALSEFRRIQFK